MLLFVSGFILGSALAVTAYLVFCHKCITRVRSGADASSHRLEELAKLTGGLAHEIKNPLSTIKVNLKLISEDADDCDAKSSRWLRKIAVVRKETDRLEQILDDFLRYIGKAELDLQSVDINELVAEMVDFYAPQTRAHGITLRLGLAEKPVVCKIDADMVKQVVLNLFINAQQAITDLGEIIVKTDSKGPDGVIEITDTGAGMTPEKTERIFEAYYTSRPGGSGLGLPTAKKIIEAHKGSITVNSQPGRGTSFTITLPLEKIQGE